MISEGYLRRHLAQYRGLGDARNIGLLDVVQTYVLEALRKYFFGIAGRFSTDLDFVVEPGSSLSEDILLWLSEGDEIHDVEFRVVLDDDRRGKLKGSTPLGDLQVDSTIEFSHRGTWLSPTWRSPVPFAFYDGLGFTPQPIPISDLNEIIAEKVAAIWRRGHARDLYDLAYLGRQALNEARIRRLASLKIYQDVEEGISDGPFSPDKLLDDRVGSLAGWGDLGLLSAKPDQLQFAYEVVDRYRFLRDLDDIEQTISRTSQSDKKLVADCINELSS